MYIFGFDVPNVALFLIGIIGVIVLWKLVKFALKLLLVIIAFFVILMALDHFQVFSTIQSIFSTII